MKIIKNNIQEFSTGAKREDKTHKSRPDLISPYFTERLGFVLSKGASKHGEKNWELGIPNESFLASLERHLVAYKQSITKGCSIGSSAVGDDHLGQLAFNLMGLIHNEEINKLNGPTDKSVA